MEKRQKEVKEELKKHIAENSLCYHIETYGCQMNEHDSEKIAGILENLGYVQSDKSAADLLIYNTCCVREHAEARVYGNIGALKDFKEAYPNAVIAVCGCMMQQEGAAKKLQRRFPYVDIVFGTNQMQQLEQMLYKVYIDRVRSAHITPDDTVIEGLPAKRAGVHSAFVNIIYGCNNFCSYCIVPYVRGRERSRKPDDIIKEIDSLCLQGVSEITLLGQNVNSYGNDTEGGLSFPRLLERIDSETDIKRIRFMTSHPKDLTDELLECYGRLKSLCEHIHLPVQSGSNRVLEAMNRRYGRERYLELVAKLRNRDPEIAITTDIIVGFPGETEEDFCDTLSLVREVKFDAAYTFAYSRRSGTKAAQMPGQNDRRVNTERLQRLNAIVAEGMYKKNEAYLGKEVEVLAESRSRRDECQLSGKTRTAKTVAFEGIPDEIGQYINVKIEGVKVHTLCGIREGK
jgi:tRNA-2-methylthio-N6-dimethylallyladenosine synthase